MFLDLTSKVETELGILGKSYIDRGELVPDEVTIAMVEDFLKTTKESNGFIFDGFPRTISQGEALSKILMQLDTNIHAVLALEVEENELVSRLLERGKVSGRTDDQSEDKIRNRFAEYNNKTEPLLEFYAAKNVLHRINGLGEIDDIFNSLCTAVDSVRS